MRTLQNLIPAQSPRKRLTLAVLASLSLLAIYGCGKNDDKPKPDPVSSAGCAIASDKDQVLGVRNFEYDDKGLLVKMTAPNFYYGTFVRTIDPGKAVDSYPSASVDGNGNHYYGTIEITYKYSGGSGNIYDGNPEFLHDLFVATNPPNSYKRDSLYTFKYDDAKKHLTTVFLPGNGSVDADGFLLFRTELVFAYDNNDNVSQAKIVYDFMRKTVVYPGGEGRIDYLQKTDETLNVVYDDKPSPYTAISKYWKFIGEDFSGFSSYNLDKLQFWIGRCAVMSKNNPVKITGKLRNAFGSPLTDINATLTYQYNEKNFPVNMAINGSETNAFTYKCK